MMLAGCFTSVATPVGAAQNDYVADVEPMMLDTDAFGFDMDLEAVQAAAEAAGVDTRSADSLDMYDVGDTEVFYTGDYGKSGWMEFTKRGNGSMCEVWVANDLSFYSPSDPRNSKVTITQDQIDYMIAEFENKILPIESEYFGVADPLNGSNSVFYDSLPMFNTTEDGKLMIMVFNIVDESFFNPSYPSYVVGYYSPTIEYYYDRNIIHIDCFDWKNRTGADSARPYVYESTIAHEYQHLLHDDLDSDEDTFINEGCSMYAEVLCNYGSPWGHINEYLASPDNSLVDWGDQGDINILADYGAAALFTIYLSDQFGGGDFISTLAANEANGAEGVEAALAEAGFEDWDFDDVFYAWKMANLLHTDEIGKGRFNYKTLDFSSPEAGSINPLSYYMYDGMVDQADYFGSTRTAGNYDTGVTALGAYGVDYIRFENLIGRGLGLLNLGFNGEDGVTVEGWDLVEINDGALQGNVWYSGGGDLKDFMLRGSLDLTKETKANLSIQTYMDVEELWDFCFVQVSTDGGKTWVSVASEWTTTDTDPDAHPNIIANLPGLTGYYEGEMWFNLTEFVGQEILYQFRYMTDWAGFEEGWYIDNVTLNGKVIDNGDDIVSLEPVYPEVDFIVTVYAPGYYVSPGYSMPALLMDVSLDELTEEGSTVMRALRMYHEVYIIVSANDGPVNYEFGLYRN